MNSMKTTPLLLAALTVSLPASAATLVNYVDGSANSLVPTSTLPGLVAGDLTNIAAGGSGNLLSSGASGPARNSVGSVTFADGEFWLVANAQQDGANGGGTSVTPISTAKYYGITLTADVGSTLSLQSLGFEWLVASNSANITSNFLYQVYISADNGPFTAVGSTVELTSFNLGAVGSIFVQPNQIVDLSAYSGISTAEIRVWLGSSSADAGTLQGFQNINVQGLVIPEPGVTLLGAAGMLAMLRRRTPSPGCR